MKGGPCEVPNFMMIGAISRNSRNKVRNPTKDSKLCQWPDQTYHRPVCLHIQPHRTMSAKHLILRQIMSI